MPISYLSIWSLPYHLYALPLTDTVFDAVVTEDRKEALRFNKFLTPHQWDVLWEKRLPVRHARYLLGRPLGAAQLARVLEDERRGSVLEVQFAYPQLTSTQQADIIEHATGTMWARTVAQLPHLDRSHLDTLAERFRGADRIEWICAHPEVSDDEALDALVYFATPSTKHMYWDAWRLTNLCTQLIHLRPGLVTRLLSLDHVPYVVISALAGTRHLRDRTQQEQMLAVVNSDNAGHIAKYAYVANPVVPIELARAVVFPDAPGFVHPSEQRFAKRGDTHISSPFESVADLNQIEWIIRRATPNDRYQRPKVVDIVALSRNPHLRRPQALRIHRLLEQANTDTCPAATLNAAMRRLEERFSIPERCHHSDTWFFDLRSANDPPAYQLVASDTPFAISSDQESDWLLNPNDRSWDAERARDAYNRIDADMLQLLRAAPSAVHDIPLPVLHAYIVGRLGDEPAAWATLFDLAPTHTGSIEALVTIAKKLRRR